MRKKKNSQSIDTTPIECPMMNEAETILPEGSLNAPQKEADGQVTVTDNEANNQAAAKDNEADGLATTAEDKVLDNVENPDAGMENYPTPTETETETETQTETGTKTETETGTETETEHQVDESDPETASLYRNIERLTACHLHDERERAGVAALLKAVIEEYAKGAFSEQTVRNLCQAINYERDFQDAFRQGEIKGRNYRIEEYLIEHRNAEEVRQLGSSSAPSRPTPPASVIGGLSAADRKSIWERGNEKRVCHH